MGKVLRVLGVVGFLVAMVVLPNIHVRDTNYLAMYVEFGVPAVLFALGHVLVRPDRLETHLEKK